MRMSNDFSRDTVGDSSSPDHRDYYDDSEGLGSFCPPLTAFVTRIQDGVPVTHAADRSRLSALQRHHSVPYNHSPGRDLTRDVYPFSPTHHDTTSVQQPSHEWDPLVEIPRPVHILGSIQWDPSHGSFAFVLPNNGIYDPQVAGSSLSYLRGYPSLDDTEFLLWPQGFYTLDSFPSYSNPVSGETDFSQDSGPLIQPPYPPRYTDHTVSMIEQLQSNYIQLPGGESQNHNSVTQHSAPGSGLYNSDLSSSSGGQVITVPQRPYAKTGVYEQHESLIFKINGRSGIPAQDAIKEIYTGLEGRDDPVLVDGADVMTLRLEWPGYSSWSRKIRLNDWKKPPQRICLGKLATAVAKCLRDFMKHIVDAGKDLDGECSDWRVGPDFIGLDRLVLVELARVSQGSWQPGIGLLPV